MWTKPEVNDSPRTSPHTVGFMAPPHTRDEASSAPSGMMRVAPGTPKVSSTVHFAVHGAMPEIQAYAQARGWFERGHSVISTPWQELHWSTDGWRSVHVVKSSDVPSPVNNGHFMLAGVSPGSEVEFAIHVGIACHAPHDTAGSRDVGELWLNNGGANYQQRSR